MTAAILCRALGEGLAQGVGQGLGFLAVCVLAMLAYRYIGRKLFA